MSKANDASREDGSQESDADFSRTAVPFVDIRQMFLDAETKRERRELLDAQLAVAEAQRLAALSALTESESRTAALRGSANSKAEGGHAKGRTNDLKIIGMLAELCGFADDDDCMKAARALRAQAENIGIHVDIEERTIADRLKKSREHVAKRSR